MISAFLLTTWSMKPGSWCEKPVVVLAPDVGRQQVVEGGDRASPGNAARDLQPLRVLVEHRVDDVDERLVAVEEAVPSGQEIALEPALAEVLGQHFHDAPVSAQALVRRRVFSATHARPVTSKTAPSRLEAVSGSGPKTRKLAEVPRDDISQERAEHAGRLRKGGRRARKLHCVVAEVGEDQVAEQKPAVRVRVCAHPATAFGR